MLTMPMALVGQRHARHMMAFPGTPAPVPSHNAILTAAVAVPYYQVVPPQDIQPDRPIGYGAFGVVWRTVSLKYARIRKDAQGGRKEGNRQNAPRQLNTDADGGSQAPDRQTSIVSNLRPSYSFKEKQTRPMSTVTGAATQPIPVPGSPVQAETAQAQSASAQLHRRSLPTPSRAIAEEGEQDTSGRPGLDLGQSNITETSSQSIESLDEVDNVQEVGYDDPELRLLDTEDKETWSETVDKKTLKKLSAKDIKFQNTIWELIITERGYCKSLKTLQILFRDGMLSELHMSPAWVDRLLPQLDELIAIHMAFLQQLEELQNRRPDRSVAEIGPTLTAQFSGDSATQMKTAYGVFCSGHLEAVQLYKDQIAKDRNFQSFIMQRQHHHLCRKLEIPGFILKVTQRPTKYPILIEAALKSTKDKKERENLVQALDLSKDVLISVNEQVKSAELQMRLREIYQRLDGRSFAIHRGKKFKKFDILANRKLLHEGRIGWKNARGKYTDVIALVLTDVLLFLQENNQKYSFYSQDNKVGVIPLITLLVREKGDTRTKGLYLLNQNKDNPEMYEIVCQTAVDVKTWTLALKSAIEKCPEEEDEEPLEADRERERLVQEKHARAQKIMDLLRTKDEEIRACCDAKHKLMLELIAVYNDTDDQQQQQKSRPNSHDFEETAAEHAGTLQAAIQEVSNAASQLTTMLQTGGSNLSRSASSVGEHASNTFPSVLMPRRAETFAGFDSQYSLPKVPVKKKGTDDGDFSESPQRSLYKDGDDSEPDLTQLADISVPAYQRSDMSEADSGRGSSPGAFSSVSTLSPMSAVSVTQEQSSVAHLLQTLNSIVHLTASQGTAVESLRAQLSEANERINKLSLEVHEKVKSGYKHNQLEELRNLQSIVQKEKMDWEKEKDREYERMEAERSQLDDMRLSLEKQEADIKAQKEDLKKQREVLQRQTEMLRQQGMLPLSQLNSSFSTGYSSDSDSRVTDFADTGNVQSNTDFTRGHRRSASAESFKKLVGQTNDKETSGKSSKDSQRPDPRPSVSKLNSFSYGNKQMPVHLLSATNEQKIGSKKVQQLPSKLLSNSPGAVVTSPSGQTTQSGVRNVAAAINASLHHTASGSHIGNHGNHSSPGAETGSHSDSNSSHIGHSASSGHIGSHHSPSQAGHHGNSQGQASNLGSSVTVLVGSRQSNRPKQLPGTGMSGLTGVMKLAEKGDKKGKSSSTSQLPSDKGAPDDHKPPTGQRPKSGTPGQRNPNIIHKPQKSDSEVIYF